MRIRAQPCAMTVPASRWTGTPPNIVATFVAGSSRGDTAPPAGIADQVGERSAAGTGAPYPQLEAPPPVDPARLDAKRTGIMR